MTFTPTRLQAFYRGIPVLVHKMDETYYYVIVMGERLPDGFLIDQHKTGNAEYIGRIPVDSRDLILDASTEVPPNQAL